MYGVGKGTCTGIAKQTVAANLNFRDLFYSPPPHGVFSSSQASAIKRVATIVTSIQGWSGTDTFSSRAAAILQIGRQVYNMQAQPGIDALNYWNNLVNSIPPAMTLDELYNYLDSDTEAGRYLILDSVVRRLGKDTVSQQSVATERVRVLTMHGAKGLEGQIVFIPGAEQGIIPSGHALSTPGQVNEERRLIYTAITRAKACCIVSLARTRIGNQAYLLSGSGVANQIRSQFVQEIGVTITNRTSGLTPNEITTIVADISNL